MASCMECIHFNPCNMHGNIIVEKPTEGNDWGLHNEVEKECKYFTPTADVVEVVRCRECKFAYKNRFLGEFYCEKTNHKIKQIHFCSYGERRTDNDLL